LSELAPIISSSVSFRVISEDLVVSNLGLVKSVVSKFVKDKSKIEDSELYSVACIAIIEASKSFDATKAKFSTWATRCMNQSILDHLRKNKKNSSVLMIFDLEESDQSKALEDRSSLNLPYHLTSIVQPSGDDSKSTIQSKQMLSMYYLEEKSLSEIGSQFGFTKEGVRKKIYKVLNEIREKNKVLLKEYLH
jgi:RNA polymerase sigma factor (sigma-70 family)